MRLLLLIFVLLCTVNAFAKCDPDNGYIQDCYDQALKTADKSLNVAYHRLMKLLTPTEQPKLRKTQRIWLQFVEQHCRFEASAYSGGSIEPITYSRCRIKETESRTKELNDSAHYDANGKCSPNNKNCTDK
jgi:uncharacterized protein YecT (DUF1311 family)